MKTQLSIVIPIYNEEKNIDKLYKSIIAAVPKVIPHYEIIFVNDGSSDKSLKLIEKLRSKNKKVKYLSFSRNFGHMAAVDAGLSASVGQKIVVMDADLQDPPSIIPKMYKKSLEGFDVVYGVKIKRKEKLVRRVAFETFYKLLSAVSSYAMPQNAGTFSLLDRKIVDLIVSLPEKQKYFSGLRAWAGYKQTGIVYERAKRYKGKEASWSRLFKLAFDGLFSFS